MEVILLKKITDHGDKTMLVLMIFLNVKKLFRNAKFSSNH